MRRFASIVLSVGLLVTLAGCSGSANNLGFDKKGTKLKVATSVYPMYEFTKAVGGDAVELVNLVPAGAEPHHWEPTPKDLQTLHQAAVFVYNGAGFEPWAEQTLKSLDRKDLIVIEASRGVELLEAHQEEGHDHGHGEWDPHVWTDPQQVIHQVGAIRDGLIKADPQNKAVYEANAEAYIDRLKELDQEFQTGLSACKKKTFFTSHAAFGYMAHRYGLEEHAIMGLTPEAEPTARELEQIVQQAKANDVRYIFFETLVSDKLAKTVANEVGAQTMVLNPFEGLTEKQMEAGEDYFSIMRENLANLKTALECGE